MDSSLRCLRTRNSLSSAKQLNAKKEEKKRSQSRHCSQPMIHLMEMLLKIEQENIHQT